MPEPEGLSNDDQDTFYGEFEDTIAQIGADALCGTFGSFDPSIFETEAAFTAFQQRSSNLAKIRNTTSAQDRRESKGGTFRLSLAVSAFSDPMLGLQKLFHVLVSDLFERRVKGRDTRFFVTQVDLGPLFSKFEEHYRPNSWAAPQIKEALDLQNDDPVLVFNLKPRSGLRYEDYVFFCEQAWKGGFHTVEMDTRDLELSGTERRKLIVDLTKRALSFESDAPKRFSANLSGPAYLIEPLFKEIHDLHVAAKAGHWFIKIDGNLDGLSTIQAIRNSFGRDDKLILQPIITCYPVLKYGLANYIPGETYVQMLAVSGADIIYPGKRPRFENAKVIEGEELDQSRTHYERAKNHIDTNNEYPMLSVAGGIHIGEVHACIALLGGNIAFFVGGGLALSKVGLETAAKSFVEAASLASETLPQKEWSAKEFNDKFVPLVEVYAEGKDDIVPDAFDYVNPCFLHDKADLAYRPESVGD